MLLPNKLQKGDTIAIVTPSKQIMDVHREYINNAIEFLKTLELKVIFAENAFAIDKYGVSGGTPEQRADDINKMFADKNVQAIWCVHGGDTANQILDLLDYDLIKKNPKIFLGKSDIDLLHMAITKMTELVTFHAPDIKIGRNKDMDFEYSKKWFEKRLMHGEIGEIEHSDMAWRNMRDGFAEGKIMGCNLSSILKSAGTKYFPDFQDTILFLETYTGDIRTVVYKLQQLKHLGIFDKINGLVVGYIYGFQDEKQRKEKPQLDAQGNEVAYEDVVLDMTKEYDFPILKINEFGHYYTNAILPIGTKVQMNSDENKIEIVERCLK